MRILHKHFYLSGALLVAVILNLAWYPFTEGSPQIFIFRTSSTVLRLSPLLASVFTLIFAALFDRFAVAGKMTLLRAAGGTYALYCIGYVSLMILARMVAVSTGELAPDHLFTYLFRPYIIPLALSVIGLPLSITLGGIYLFWHRRFCAS